MANIGSKVKIRVTGEIGKVTNKRTIQGQIWIRIRLHDGWEGKLYYSNLIRYSEWVLAEECDPIEPLKVVVSPETYLKIRGFYERNPIEVDGKYNLENDLKYIEFMRKELGDEIVDKGIAAGGIILSNMLELKAND